MSETGQFPVSRIKISPPIRRAEIVTRPRLIDRLYEEFDQKLILVVAPAGYGKTTLLLDLATASDVAICWLTLDSLDQEPQRFLNYIVASIQYRFPAFGKESLAALEGMISVEADGERLLIAITNEIRSRIFEHFVLILDDYHLIDASTDIRRLVSRFVQLAGENVHILLASRSLPTIPDMPLLVARGLVAGISFEDMAFQPDEISQYFIQNSGRALSKDEAQQIAQDTEGWIAAIHLTNALTSLHVPARPFSALADLFDFFASEVLDKQTAEVREFLLATSLFEAFDADLCKSVLDPLLPGEPRPWNKLIGVVQASNVFTVPLGQDGQWMRYHNMFKQFLVSQLQYEQPTLSWHIQKNLATYYEDHQFWEEALHLYDSLGDQEGMVGVFAKAGSQFLNSGKLLTLANWLARVPISVQQEQPLLLSLQGAVNFTQGNVQLGISLLSQAEEAFRKADDRSNLALTLTRRASAYRQTGQFPKALEDAEGALQLIDGSSTPEARATQAEALRVKGQALFRLDQPEQALTCLEDALRIYSDLDLQAYVPIVEMELGVLCRARGDTDGALRHYQVAREAWEKSGNLGWKATLLNNMGVVFHQAGRFSEAFVALEEALLAAEESGFTRTQALAYNSLGDLLYDLQDTDQAMLCHSKALELAIRLGDSFLEFYERLAHIRLELQAKRPDQAYELLQTIKSEEASHTPYRVALVRTEEGHCLLARNQAREASVVLEQAVSLLLEGGRAQELLAVRLWLAAALGKEDALAGLAQFEILRSNWGDEQARSHLLITALHCLPWLKDLADKSGQQGDIFRGFVADAEKYSEELAATRRQLRQVSKRVPISPPKIAVKALGNAQVLRDGKPLTLSDWQTHEARDLFLFLLFSPPQTKEQIALVFWPDISPARLKMRFKTNIYRIRQALGQNVIVFDDEYYRFNRASDYSCDVDEFHVLLTEAHQTSDLEARLVILRNAVEKVQGAFLADMDAVWITPLRMDLSREYYDALLELAERYLSVGDAQNCLLMSQRALVLDPLQEKVHRLRMQAFAVLRDRVGLARQYQECRDVLHRELGIAPSNETAMLYERLIG